MLVIQYFKYKRLIDKYYANKLKIYLLRITCKTIFYCFQFFNSLKIYFFIT